ncbi:DUF3298 domain-containing protein [Fusibacter bizertensis]|uniref:DUF3298 domain-containing protein n=1 Tax=Fusibacter bizertensis TaxID=1488331 RepID=A0ABT6NBM9_9FIRM|nr:anti-sigma-V factor rsiV [Fusibacter bizertensis]MDH8677822.1 DUF3298 domain-containing protein [Fusibacter bizertensis]
MNINDKHIKEQLQNEIERYKSSQIPDDLEMKIRRTFKVNRRKKSLQRVVATAAAVMLLLLGSANINESFAIAISEIPVLGNIVKVLNFRFETIDNENIHVNVETPVITGLDNEVLENSLNAKYYEENKALYDDFIANMGEVEAVGGHMGFDSGYEVKTDTDEILSIGRYYVNTVGSSSTTFSFDTIDKIEGIMITLPSLFKDQTYVETISKYLVEKMEADMKADSDKIYWVGEDDIEAFKQINEDQNFYITAEGKLIISFDKYEIAPGYMGTLEFEIPTEIISDLLVSDKYIH